MVLPPFFLQPGEAAIITYIRTIACKVTLPIIVQYAPNQTGVRFSPDVFLRLCEECPNIRFIKVETQPPGRYVSQLIAGSKGKLGAFVGYAGVQMPDVLDRGAVGIQPGCSLSEVYVRLFHLYESGKRGAFDTLSRELLPYISYWMQGVELIIRAEKVMLQRRGIIASDHCREPHYTLDALEVQMIDHCLEWFQHEFYQH
jgi:4-hydroxy-tetrahydrodipicolinate synthase